MFDSTSAPHGPAGVVPAGVVGSNTPTPVPIEDARPLPGVAEASELAYRMACAAGQHAWVPWLRLDNGSSVTWCCREGCNHSEQWDAP